LGGSEEVREWFGRRAVSARTFGRETPNLFLHSKQFLAENVLRHSFGSYHLAEHQDAPRLALDMGHVSPHMIFGRYREIATREEAERYWNIFPSPIAE
jgi:hypothetical protein